jgi:hypothetical protein
MIFWIESFGSEFIEETLFKTKLNVELLTILRTEIEWNSRKRIEFDICSSFDWFIQIDFPLIISKKADCISFLKYLHFGLVDFSAFHDCINSIRLNELDCSLFDHLKSSFLYNYLIASEISISFKDMEHIFVYIQSLLSIIHKLIKKIKISMFLLNRIPQFLTLLRLFLFNTKS